MQTSESNRNTSNNASAAIHDASATTNNGAVTTHSASVTSDDARATTHNASSVTSNSNSTSVSTHNASLITTTHSASVSTHNVSSLSTHNTSVSTHSASSLTTHYASSATTHPGFAITNGSVVAWNHATNACHHGLFCYLEDNHTSVIGMRECAKEKGAQACGISFEEIDNILQDAGDNTNKAFPQESSTPHRNALFAFPAQSNFSGQKYPLDWCTKVKQGRLATSSRLPHHHRHSNWYVLLDAAAMAATSQLDLAKCTADFVTISFYKMFGFPTGLGALIVRKGSEHVLKRKSYFGGGTVLAYLSGEQFHAPKTSIQDW